MLIGRLSMLLLACFLLSDKLPLAASVSKGEFQEYSFSLTRLPENPKQYSLVISDTDEHTISGVFSLDRLEILRAMMTEAGKFALSEEAVGSAQAITTRFADKHDGAFIVDVEKLGNQSRLFLTVKSEIGRMTVEAGKTVRSTRREYGFFFDLLTRLETELRSGPSKRTR